MPNWKVQLVGADDMLTQLALAHKTPDIYISRDGTECFLESTNFAMTADHNEVKRLAAEIIQTIIKAGSAPGGAAISTGLIYQMHYDNSKTVFRD
ncbi:MAG: hypothetical protein K8F91_12420 [Candidatus Obscuribacterales bacterium]|nr:hypothetical protein [Candidatus Obscuribacterales bacterium]